MTEFTDGAAVWVPGVVERTYPDGSVRVEFNDGADGVDVPVEVLRPDGVSPGGRPITAQDVRRAYGHGLDRIGVADYLNRIARGAPERGDDEPRPITDDEFVRCPECGGVVRGWVLRRADESRKANRNLPADPEHPVVANMIEAQAMGACDLCASIPTAGSLPVMPPEVREALDWFLCEPETIGRKLNYVGEYAATLVRWLLSVTGDSAEPEQDDGPFGTTCTYCSEAITDDTPVESYGYDDGGDLLHYACSDEGAPSSRSWSLPAPSPDDVTVVHVGGVRFDRDLDMWRDSVNGEALRWGELLDTGTVVEGRGEPADLPPVDPRSEPQAAEPPRFEREVESIAVTLWQLWGDVSPGCVTSPGPIDQRFSDLVRRVRALAAAGAVREEEERDV